MLPDQVSNPGPLALESDGLPTALRSPALILVSALWADRGPVVQSILSLTSLLRGQLVKCFTTL